MVVMLVTMPSTLNVWMGGVHRVRQSVPTGASFLMDPSLQLHSESGSVFWAFPPEEQQQPNLHWPRSLQLLVTKELPGVLRHTSGSEMSWLGTVMHPPVPKSKQHPAPMVCA